MSALSPQPEVKEPRNLNTIAESSVSFARTRCLVPQPSVRTT